MDERDIRSYAIIPYRPILVHELTQVSFLTKFLRGRAQICLFILNPFSSRGALH